MRAEGTKRVLPAFWLSVVKALPIAIIASLVGIVLFALALMFLPIPETAVPIVNQLVKASSIALGAFIAVGRGGEKGLLKGGMLGALYSLAGLALYAVTGGITDTTGIIATALSDAVLATAIGAVTGILAANCKPR